MISFNIYVSISNIDCYVVDLTITDKVTSVRLDSERHQPTLYATNWTLCRTADRGFLQVVECGAIFYSCTNLAL